MAKHRRRRAGRPRKTGDRKPSGQLRWKPPGPNETVVERRKAMLGDAEKAPLHMASNPLDLAFARGWLTERQHRAGESFARLRRSAGLDSPGMALASSPELDTAGDKMVRTWAELSDEEISGLWDRVLNRGGASASEGDPKAMTDWVAICGALSVDQLREVELVCVHDSWPQWINQRCAGRSDTSWERKRTLLVDGLELIAFIMAAIHPNKARQAALAVEPISLGQIATLPVRKVEEAVCYVDEEGEPLVPTSERGVPFEVVRRRRVG